MSTYSEIFEPHRVEPGQTLELVMGALRLWVYRDMHDWHIAHELDRAGEERFSISVTDRAQEAERSYTRWILNSEAETVQFRPQLPDRPIIVRPETPMCLLPKQSVKMFIGVPIWLTVVFGEEMDQALEIPTQVLSNSWFGPFTDGELCYALKTRAKLNHEQLLPSVQRAVFPLEIKNASSGKLNFERFCLRPQYLSIFQGATRLWTGKGRVSYRGEENWSRIVYASGPPEFDQAERRIGKAREKMDRGLLLKTFDGLKQRVDIE
jgi:hypothetical protein